MSFDQPHAATGDQGTMSQAEAAQRIFRDPSEIPWLQVATASVVVIVLIFAVKHFVRKLASWLPERFRFYVLPWAPILRLSILAAAVTYLTPLIIVPTARNLLAIGGGLAVAIGFAFKDYVSSLLAGVVVLVERPYRTGDWIRIGDAYGEVAALGMRSVEIVTPDDTRVVIPHGVIWSEAVHNDNSGARELMCVAEFFLDPDHDGDEVRATLRDVALTSPFLHLERQVAVVAAERPWGSHYRLKAYPIEGRDQFRFTTDLTVRGKAALRRRGIRAVRPEAVAAVGA